MRKQTPHKETTKVIVHGQTVQAASARALQLKGPPPAKSIAKAKSVFKNFNLSKFAVTPKQPSNYVGPKRNVAQVQRQIISRSVETLAQVESSRALTLALPQADIKQLLPSLDEKAGTIELDELMGVIQKFTRGTEFYADGNATLNRLSIQTKVQQLIDAVKGDVKK